MLGGDVGMRSGMSAPELMVSAQFTCLTLSPGALTFYTEKSVSWDILVLMGVIGLLLLVFVFCFPPTCNFTSPFLNPTA